MSEVNVNRRGMIGRLAKSVVAVVAVTMGTGRVAEAASPSAWWYAGLDWVRNREWLSRWTSIAAKKISGIRNSWKRSVLLFALKKAIGGASAASVRSYLQGQGMYCPDKPWWVVLGPYDVAWVVITCAHHAE